MINKTNIKELDDHSKLIYISSILNYESIIAPISVIFYIQHIGLTFSEYCILDAVLCILLAIFEVPSGYLADFFGRKKTLIISYISVILSLLILIFSNSFLGALIAIIVQGCIIPIGTGNSEAIYFESFNKYDKTNTLESIYAKQGSIMFISLSVMSIISGVLASINIVFPIIIAIFLVFLNLIFIGFLMHDTKCYSKKKLIKPTINLKRLKFNYKGLLNVTPIFLICSLFFCATRVSYSYYQPLFTEFSIGIEYFGLIFAFFNIVCFLISLLAPKVFKFLSSEFKIFLLLLLLMIISFIGVIYCNSTLLLILFLCFQQVVRALHYPYFKVRNNYYINPDSDYRVTYISYSNLINTSMLSFFLMIFSILNNKFELIITIKYLGFIFLITALCILSLHFILKKKGKILCYQCQE